MSAAESFAPVANPSAKTLILGSMPGVRSLELQQYYGHPQNSFWRIIAELTGTKPDDSYEERLQTLKEQQFALWDVLQFCERPGSLDAAIISATAVPNDFRTFFSEHPNVTRVFFNGAKAHDIFIKRIFPTLSEAQQQKLYQRLPSTSPAHARMPFAEKLACWAVLKT